jgi:predicted RecA/RadA family phage recombinase
MEADTVLADPSVMEITTTAALTGGQVIQLPDGRAGIVLRDKAATTAASPASIATEGVFDVTKTASIVILDGGRLFWDHSANAATFRAVNDRDFYLGTAVGDATSDATAVRVDLNRQQAVEIDIRRDGVTIASGTQAAGGFGAIFTNGVTPGLSLTATSEVQKIDLLSVPRRAVGANAIAEYIVALGANGSTSAVDINVGLANGTHATDADSITESVFFHIDGGSLNILAESDDGTTEVAATDTTVDITEGAAEANKVEFWIDTRDPASVKLYVDGVRVLSGSTFVLTAATGPLGLLAHVEKTTGTATAGPLYIHRGIMRTCE